MRTYVRLGPALVAGVLLISCAGPAERLDAVATSPSSAAEAPAVAGPTGAGPTGAGPTGAGPTGADREGRLRPVRLRIPAIGVDTDLEGLGVSRRGRLKPPVDPQRAGWFPDSAVPGDLGAAVVAGHRDSTEGPAVFWRLTDLRPGDVITVDRSDGAVERFEVADVRRVPRDDFPTEEVYGPTPDSTLRLITCGGLYDNVHGRYVDNVLVLALSV